MIEDTYILGLKLTHNLIQFYSEHTYVNKIH